MEHKQRDEILRKLMHKPGMGFNELWSKDGDSNKFAYHLKVLEQEGLIKKGEEKYFLTDDGKALAAFVDGDTGKKSKMPASTMLIAIFRGENEIVQYIRTKEPFYGYCGFIGAKMKFGEEILEAAARELKEETNLEADLKIAGQMNFRVFIDGELKFHNLYNIIVATNPKGELIGDDREGKYEYVKIEDFKKQKLFPDNKKILELLEECKYFTMEVEVDQKDGEFLDVRYKDIVKFN